MAADPASAIRVAAPALPMRAHGRVRPLLVACGAPAARTSTELGAPPDLSLDPSTIGAPGWATRSRRPGGGPRAGCSPSWTTSTPPASRTRSWISGDFPAAFTAAVAAFWRRVPVAHLDAGVRSHDLTSPFPEEGHRRMISQITSLHLATTPTARTGPALEAHVGPKVVVVGSTAVDAITRGPRRSTTPFPELERAARVAAVVLDPMRARAQRLVHVLRGVADLVLATPGLEVVLPAPRGTALRALAGDALGRLVRVTISDPLPQPDLQSLVPLSTLAITDVAPLAEQAPSLATPTLVLTGERGAWTEPDRAGHPWTAGPDHAVIARIAEMLALGDRGAPSARNPFGDGRASERCEQAVEWLLGVGDRPADFDPDADPGHREHPAATGDQLTRRPAT